MSDNDPKSWKRFKRLKFDRRNLSRRAKNAETATTRHAHRFILRKLSSLRNARRSITIWLALMIVLIGATALQTIWFEQSYRKVGAVSGGTYAEAVDGPIETLNPLFASSNAELSASRLIFSGLLSYDGTGHLQNDLAESVSTDKTGEQYTVKLKPNLKWHDGKTLDANDIVYTVNLMKNPETRSSLRTTWQAITAEAVDANTVKFTLPSSYAAFRHALTFAVLPKHILQNVSPDALRENNFSLSPVGSGPFSFTRMQNDLGSKQNKIVYMTRWDDYYRGAPKIHHFELHGFKQKKELLQALKTGEVNAAIDITNPKDIPKRFEVENYKIDSGVYALFNTQSAILSDQIVRKALQVGTDTASLRDAVSPNLPKLDTPFVQSQINTGTLPTAPAYNVGAAQKLLEKNGWKLDKVTNTRMKNKKPLTLRVVTIKDPEYSAALKNLKTQWQKLGIKIETQEYDSNDNTQNFVGTVLQPRNYDVLIYQLVLGADPDIYAYWHSSQATVYGRNLSNYKSEVGDDILVSARGNVNEALRDRKYISFANEWLADAPALGLYQSVIHYAHGRSVSLQPVSKSLPSSTDRYADVQYWTAEQGSVYKTP